MFQEEFLPVVFTVQLAADQALPIEKWRSWINDLLHIYVDQITKNEDRIIGHIKALAQINEQEFINYSCVSNSNIINSKLHSAHQDVFKINMIVNSLVANISENESRILLDKACQFLIRQNPQIRIEIENHRHHGHHHHHGHGDDCPICNGHQHS